MALTNPVNANTQGFQVVNTTTGVWSGRTLTPGAGISITNQDGTGGDPVISVTGGGTAIEVVDGDVGSVSGTVITLTGGSSGAIFTGSGTTMTESFNFLSLPTTTSTNGQIRINGVSVLQALDAISGNTNIYVGLGAGNFTASNLRCVGAGTNTLSQPSSINADTTAIGYTSLSAMQSGSLNTSVGSTCLEFLPFGSNNTALGFACGVNMVSSSSDNIFIGSRTAQNYTGGESSNILIGSQLFGTVGESHVLRIGNFTGTGQGGLNASYIQGINGVTIPNTTSAMVTIDDTSSQLGTAAFGTKLSFTPIIFGGTVPGTATYTNQIGNYTQIGNMVFFEVLLTWNSATGTGPMNLGGFPIVIASPAASVIPITFYSASPGIGAGNSAFAGQVIGQTYMNIDIINNTTGVVTALPMVPAATISMQGFYYV